MKHIFANMAISALLQSATLPSGHLAIINEMQRKKGKPILDEGQLLARKVRLTGNQLTSHYTRFADAEIQRFTDQINNGGAPLLSAHVTDDTPLGAFYAAEMARDGDNLWLDTWAYWLNNDAGIELANQIDAGIINEASIGVAFSKAICSITGLNYSHSPYYAGNEYEITDPVTGQTTKRLCFVWLMECIIREGSVCYRGAHPDTRVGGEFAASIQLSGNSDLASIFNKQAVSTGTPKLTFALESTQPSAREKGETVNPRLLAALGLSATATEQDVLNAIQLLITANGSLQMLTQQSTPDASLAVATAWQNSHTQLSVVTAELNQLRHTLEQRDLMGLIDQGHKDGKLTTEAQRDWAKTLSPAALTAFLAATPPNPVLAQTQAQEITPSNSVPSSLTEDERLIVIQTGISETAFLEQKVKMAQA